MAYINNNFLSNNIFFIFGQFPKNINLLDDFSIIHYKGYTLPRIGFNQIGNNIKDQTGCPVKPKDKQKNDNGSTDIVISIEKDESESENNEKQHKISDATNDLFSLEGSESLFTNNFKEKIDKYITENKNIELIPPKRIIAAIGFIDEGNENKENINEIINNILQENMIPIKSCHNQINGFKEENPFPKIANNNIFPTFMNSNLKFMQNPINLNNSPNFENQNLNKQFLISPEKGKKLICNKRIRGRKGIKESNLDKRVHSASDDDNVLRKIQVHFLSFVVHFTNDVIRTLVEDKNAPLFKNLDYKIKKIVKHKVVEDFKSKTIGEILKSRISPKMKTHDAFVNGNIYEEICNKYPLMKEFLQTEYINLFKEYYNNKDRKFEVSGKIIQLSSKTKTYNDLVLKNYQYKEKIKYVTINYFLNSYKRRKKPNFMTYTYEK